MMKCTLSENIGTELIITPLTTTGDPSRLTGSRCGPGAAGPDGEVGGVHKDDSELLLLAVLSAAALADSAVHSLQSERPRIVQKRPRYRCCTFTTLLSGWIWFHVSQV